MQSLLFQHHSPTSHAAAAGNEPRAGTQRARVLEYLRDRGPVGATDEEMQRLLPMASSTQRPRRVELCRANLVKDSGRIRETVSGADAVVWEAA